MRSLLFDASALVALFAAHDRVYALWIAAEEASVPVLLPATAIAEANRKLRASDGAWSKRTDQEETLADPGPGTP
jgi:predicted nucleic acid-binding protein